MERKKDLSHLMIKTYLFCRLVCANPQRHLPFPRHRVEGHRHLRQRADSPRFHTFPDFCLRLESIGESGSCSFRIFKAFLSLLLDIVGGFRRRIWKVGDFNCIRTRESMAIEAFLHFLFFLKAT